jgi:hypothetical protein
MKRHLFTTAAALLGLGLFCGCANMTGNNNCCGEREGLFARWFGHRGNCGCECAETGLVTAGEGPVIPEPCCGAPCGGTPTFMPTAIPVTPPYGPLPATTAPPALPFPNPLAQPIPANPSSQVKDAAK